MKLDLGLNIRDGEKEERVTKGSGGRGRCWEGTLGERVIHDIYSRGWYTI